MRMTWDPRISGIMSLRQFFHQQVGFVFAVRSEQVYLCTEESSSRGILNEIEPWYTPLHESAAALFTLLKNPYQNYL